MTYKMNVTIYNPETPEGMTSNIFLSLDCRFFYDPNQYGNGHYLTIKGDRGFENHYDIRYDYDFKRNDKPGYLEKWARSYWSGKDGAYTIKSLEIHKVD